MHAYFSESAEVPKLTANHFLHCRTSGSAGFVPNIIIMGSARMNIYEQIKNFIQVQNAIEYLKHASNDTYV